MIKKVLDSGQGVWMSVGNLIHSESVVTTNSDLTILLQNRHNCGCPFGKSDRGGDVALFEMFQLCFDLGMESVGHQTSMTKLGLGICIHLKSCLDSLEEPKFIPQHWWIMVNDLLVS